MIDSGKVQMFGDNKVHISLLKEVSRMSDYNFESIKNTVFVWYEKLFSNDNTIRIAKDNDETLIIDFGCANCLAQLSVSNSKYNPYQYIFFEAVDLEIGSQIYCFYDNINMLQSEVVIALDEAYKFCINY